MRKIIFLLVFVGTLSLFPISTAHAIPVSPILNFGGRVLTVVPCLNGIWATVFGPSGGSYFYIPGISGLRLYGPPTEIGQLVLGNALGFMFCFEPIPFPPFIIPIGGGLLVLPNAGSSFLPNFAQ